MAWKRVASYNLGYSIPNKQFYFWYRLDGENVSYQFFPSAADAMALADMFRNEGPMNFNDVGRYFVTAAEEIGEEETAP